VKNEKFTLEKFYDLLPIVADRKWTIFSDGGIRDENQRCPICSLVNAIDDDILYVAFAEEALDALGMDYSHKVTDNIMMAADINTRSKIRAKMIAILKPTVVL